MKTQPASKRHASPRKYERCATSMVTRRGSSTHCRLDVTSGARRAPPWAGNAKNHFRWVARQDRAPEPASSPSLLSWRWRAVTRRPKSIARIYNRPRFPDAPRLRGRWLSSQFLDSLTFDTPVNPKPVKSSRHLRRFMDSKGD
jgi:hypothetical protein